MGGGKVVEEKFVKYNGDVGVRKYVRGAYLGKGGFAHCYELRNTETGHTSAAKVI